MASNTVILVSPHKHLNPTQAGEGLEHNVISVPQSIIPGLSSAILPINTDFLRVAGFLRTQSVCWGTHTVAPAFMLQILSWVYTGWKFCILLLQCFGLKFGALMEFWPSARYAKMGLTVLLNGGFRRQLVLLLIMNSERWEWQAWRVSVLL